MCQKDFSNIQLDRQTWMVCEWHKSTGISWAHKYKDVGNVASVIPRKHWCWRVRMHDHVDKHNDLAGRRLWDLAPEKPTYGHIACKPSV